MNGSKAQPRVAAHIPSKKGPSTPAIGNSGGNQPPSQMEEEEEEDSSAFSSNAPKWDQATLDLVNRAKLKRWSQSESGSGPPESREAIKNSAGTKRAMDQRSPEATSEANKKTKFQDEERQSLFFHYKERKDGARIGKTEIDLVSAHFRNQIDEVDGEFQVRIGAIRTYRGFGTIECHDQKTFDWALEVVSKMGGGAFVSHEEKEVKQPTVKVGMRLEDREPPNPMLIFSAIRKQNGGLDTSKWRMLSANPIKGKKGGFFVLVEMDEPSYQAIQPPNRFYYYTQEIVFSFKPGRK